MLPDLTPRITSSGAWRSGKPMPTAMIGQRRLRRQGAVETAMVARSGGGVEAASNSSIGNCEQLIDPIQLKFGMGKVILQIGESRF